MPKKKSEKKAGKKVAVESYRHESVTRKNIPTAKIAAEGTVPRVEKAHYAYSAHLPPELRFDASGQSDRVSEIVEKAASGSKLTKEEADILRGLAGNASQPWLEWSGKKEEHDRAVLEVEPVALHIHERVSASAIIRVAKREDVQAELFADPKQEYREAIQFYRHDVDWANRLILGDSLEVMSSLGKREALAEKVQMIYIDPPYGIKYQSNFQPEVGNKNVKDTDSHMIREPEMVKAYRDTWQLGLHSYLSYLQERLLVSRNLLTPKGSIFLQISDENQHRVRNLLDEVFGPENFVALIPFRKKSMPLGAKFLEGMDDYLVWYAKDKEQAFYKHIYREQDVEGLYYWGIAELADGTRRRMSKDEISDHKLLPEGSVVARTVSIKPPTFSPSAVYPVSFEGRDYLPGNGCWIVNKEAMERLIGAGRIVSSGKSLQYFYKHTDFPYAKVTANWFDMGSGNFTDKKIYTVQTASKVIERCLHMVTKPGDLVLDPTCGSGTTAVVAEKLGRRWITIDSSRVSISLARQRILTEKYDYYQLEDETKGVSSGFVCKTAPKINLRSIARNDALDPIYQSYDKDLEDQLDACNEALLAVGEDVRKRLVEKLAQRLQSQGVRSVSTHDVCRWLLPGTSREIINEAFRNKSKLQKRHIEHYCNISTANSKFQDWTIPWDVDPTYPSELSTAIESYREKWLERKRAVDECIANNADQEVLVDRPVINPSVVRVAGPFTVEGVRPEELSLDENGELFDPTPNELEEKTLQDEHAQNASAYLDRMLQLLGKDGVTFPNNEYRRFHRVERFEGADSALHAEALWEGADDGDVPNVAIAFGPQHGPVTASQVEDLIRASRRYDELVIAAFSFDGSSQAVIQESANPRLKIHMAHIRPDVSPGMDGLLKDSPKSQLFTVFGQPEIDIHKDGDDIRVELLGVDIYSPLTGEITSSGANKVAAWFLDSDYDGRCFCITQAFFPNQKAWDKIAKALGSSADAEAFEAYNGTISVPFEPGEHQRIAVKVIDPRGNEVMAIRGLKEPG